MRGLLQRRRAPEAAPPPPPPRPFPRTVHPLHHALRVLVLRPDDAPAAGARLVVRPYGPEGALRDPVARATTDAQGEAELLLPAGRYAVSARHGADARCVAVHVERPGRTVLHLEPAGPRAVLAVDVVRPDGRPAVDAYVEARSPEGHLAARGWTDERGAAALLVPPGPLEVRVGEARARVEAMDEHVRVELAFEEKPAPKPFPGDPSLPPR